MLKAGQVFFLPIFGVSDFNLINTLKTPASLPNWHCKPQFSLVVFEPVSVYPASSQGKLDIIEQHQLFRLHTFGK